MKLAHPLYTASASKHFPPRFTPTQDDDNMLLGVFWQTFPNSSVIVQFVYTPVQFICASNIYCFINKRDLGLATYELLSFVLFQVFFGQKNETKPLGFGNSHQTYEYFYSIHVLTDAGMFRSWFSISKNLYFIVLILKLGTKEAIYFKAYKEKALG